MKPSFDADIAENILQPEGSQSSKGQGKSMKSKKGSDGPGYQPGKDGKDVGLYDAMQSAGWARKGKAGKGAGGFGKVELLAHISTSDANLGAPVATLHVEHFSSNANIGLTLASADTQVQVQQIITYSFIDSNGTTPRMARMIIPGFPRALRSFKKLGRLDRDTADFIIDENRLQIPKLPTLPIFTAMLQVMPGYDFSNRVVGQSNDVRKLLGSLRRDCSGTAMLVGPSGERDASFRLDVDILPNGAMILTRHEYQNVLPSRYLPRNTFGRSFHEQVTQVLVSSPYDVSSFYAINHVELGKFSLLVQAEIDAVEYKDSKLEVLPCGEWMMVADGFALEACQGGVRVCPDSVAFVEVKSKSWKTASDIDWLSCYFQMLLANCKALVLGKHKSGHFGEPVRISLEEVGLKVGVENIKLYLVRLELLLHEIREVALKKSVGQMSILCDGIGGPLQIKVRNSEQTVLPH